MWKCQYLKLYMVLHKPQITYLVCLVYLSGHLVCLVDLFGYLVCLIEPRNFFFVYMCLMQGKWYFFQIYWSLKQNVTFWKTLRSLYHMTRTRATSEIEMGLSVIWSSKTMQNRLDQRHVSLLAVFVSTMGVYYHPQVETSRELSPN